MGLNIVLPCADLAFFSELFFRHSEIGIVTEAGLTEDGELCLFPVHPVVSVRTFGCRHRATGIKNIMITNII